MSTFDLKRFVDAQIEHYSKALAEIKNARKETHWMWFIFPQIQGLGYSSMSVYYSIKSHQEAIDYLQHPILCDRLIEITKALVHLREKNPQLNASHIFGEVDALKLKSSLTLFAHIVQKNQAFHDDLKFQIFAQTINLYFQGQYDLNTLEILRSMQS